MDNFEPGQRVICIDDNYEGQVPSHKPIKDKVYLVLNSGFYHNTPYIKLEGFLGWWQSKYFSLFDTDFADNLLAEIAEEINEENLVTV